MLRRTLLAIFTEPMQISTTVPMIWIVWEEIWTEIRSERVTDSHSTEAEKRSMIRAEDMGILMQLLQQAAVAR